MYRLFRLNRLSLEPEPRLKTVELEPKAAKVSSSRAWNLEILFNDASIFIFIESLIVSIPLAYYTGLNPVEFYSKEIR